MKTLSMIKRLRFVGIITRKSAVHKAPPSPPPPPPPPPSPLLHLLIDIFISFIFKFQGTMCSFPQEIPSERFFLKSVLFKIYNVDEIKAKLTKNSFAYYGQIAST